MGQMYTFHKSVRGQGHINRGVPCEDSSASFTSDDSRYHIAIIADGHGQEKSFRSKTGSQAAVNIALECLKGFAEVTLSTPEGESRFYQDILNNPRYRQMTMRQLTNTILAGWSDYIHEDYSANPPSEEELGEFAEYYRDENKVPQIYGTTLIAALRLPKCLVLIHQGDGRCDVFYSDGSVDQPIPWDVRCEGNQTTSLCDEDAAESFRHCIIDIEKKPVVACYVGSDGVEDAYRSQEGTHTFYRDLSCALIEKYETDFDEYLDEMLPEFSARGRFSKTGSQDDVSVSGIVDIDAVRELNSTFQIEVQKYALGEDLFWKEDELRSKMRKHAILQKRVNESQERVDQAILLLRTLESERDVLVSQLGSLQDRIQNAQRVIEENQSDFNSFQGYLQSGTVPEETEAARSLRALRKHPHVLKELIASLNKEFSSDEAKLARMLGDREALEQSLKAKEAAIDAAKSSLDSLQAQADQAQATFEEYDAKYQAISSEINKLRAQIANMPIAQS
ncbi:MAG: protein phosphatase 2C domain-containing protein [Segatella copri]